MTALPKPKLILFDIGGVCVILDYELSLGIIPGWINYAISQSAPNGFWHRLERGEIPMDDAFFAGFSSDLHHRKRWEAFYQRARSKDATTPSPTKAESEDPTVTLPVPDLPQINAKQLFNDMMQKSTTMDPWMFPALQALKSSKQFLLGALSNTVIFPASHPLGSRDSDAFFRDPLRSMFDFFVSSAHVGVRKPQPEIYQLALARANQVAGTKIEPGDVLFLDDIGENLREARRQGFRTLKVPLGKAFEAVDELETITGLKLAGNHPREPILPQISTARSKI
ncbi:hypothetical protein TD95_004217 [Thielaviopsis punctulata]|uniref:Uncharacterized protein n=1 Tax=Thielaviopsis punctulata TaxID=72032 RepID=A0A0F4ZKC6_9PEZI|nr:hypothetical protein TD95_004217 [Thielaviopsis punctulata]